LPLHRTIAPPGHRFITAPPNLPITILPGDPRKNSTLLAVSSGQPHPSPLADTGAHECSGLFYTLPAAGTYHLVVTGRGEGDEGDFSLKLICEDSPAAAVEDSCGLQMLTCGDNVVGTNVGYPNFGEGSSPAAMYAILLFEPMKLAATTCNSMASFPTYLSVYDGKPENSSRVAQSYSGSDNEVGCGTVFFDAPVSGMYFVTVEGMETGETGVFDLGKLGFRNQKLRGVKW
jgi:hypothetical protein